MKLPVVSGSDVIKILVREGYVIQSRKGSHVTLKNSEEPNQRVTVPLHDALKRGTLLNILGQAGISREDLLKKL